jgi:hypothetical protein
MAIVEVRAVAVEPADEADGRLRARSLSAYRWTDSATMGPKTKPLIETLGELVALLRSHGDTLWASWFESDLADLRNGDFHGVTHHLSAYGGAGSFNDFSFATGNETRTANERLFQLRSQAWQLADEVRRTVDSERD